MAAYRRFPKYMVKLLKMQIKLSKNAYLVENKKGERMSIRSYQYMFERLTEKAEVRKLNFHALRHTFATRADRKSTRLNSSHAELSRMPSSA